MEAATENMQSSQWGQMHLFMHMEEHSPEQVKP